jgi:ubiquinone/menaquinone biosynthesis C-methylase UbiE
MVGVDVSKKAIDIARNIEKKEPLNIEYHVGSICDLSITREGTFDIVVSNLVLQDLQDIEKAIQEIHRVLKPKGELIFSIMHPCFSSPPVRGWVRRPVDSQRKEDWLYWKVDQYFNRVIEEWQYFDVPPVFSFHRTLSDYVKVLVNNGFSITDLEEPTVKKKDIEEHYREFGNEFERIPWFLIISAIKQK